MEQQSYEGEIQRHFPQTWDSAVQVIDQLLSFAVYLHASDIHCDPLEKNILIRLRIDGQMTVVGTLPRNILDECIARLKILSGARTDLHIIPQDGRWRLVINGQDYNIRISFMPTYYGENAVLRILPAKSQSDLSFAKLGFAPDHVNLIEKALERKHGLILVTGPTGSGKTTTLRTCLSQKSKQPLSIITLEDPVEYEIEGTRQVHIRHSHGISFANGLRSALRQDPDVIMVGEIRDNETAKVAIHTALTGHLVLSTLHTNSALETILRLVDMGIDHYLLASTLKLVIAQRLIRNICQNCHTDGCDVCNKSGYFGRSVIAEVLEIDKGFAELIAKEAHIGEFAEYSKSLGFREIKDDGFEKVYWGVTSREEVLNTLYS